ncbi:MAG: hypothetical protein ACP5OX_01010, partial [Minisyncoccia bacterium]
MLIKYLERKKVEDIIKKPLIKGNPELNKNNISEKIRKVLSNKLLSVVSSLLIIIFISLHLGSTVRAPIFLGSKEAVALYDEERAKLEKELEEVEKEIAEYEKIVAKTQQEKKTLQNKINELKRKAEQLNL